METRRDRIYVIVHVPDDFKIEDQPIIFASRSRKAVSDMSVKWLDSKSKGRVEWFCFHE